jgi:hypothetical protein
VSDLYDTDILEWSQRQAALLRRIAEGERLNELDWPNIAEEIEDVGRSELHSVESLLTLALLHDLKAQAWPLSLAADGWHADARLYRRQARRRFTPSMHQKIDLASLYADALTGLPEKMDGQPPLPIPATCPVTLDELLAYGAPEPPWQRAFAELRRREAVNRQHLSDALDAELTATEADPAETSLPAPNRPERPAPARRRKEPLPYAQASDLDACIAYFAALSPDRKTDTATMRAQGVRWLRNNRRVKVTASALEDRLRSPEHADKRRRRPGGQ